MQQVRSPKHAGKQKEQQNKSLNTEKNLSSSRMLNIASSKGTQEHTALGDDTMDRKQDFKTGTNEPI